MNDCYLVHEHPALHWFVVTHTKVKAIDKELRHFNVQTETLLQFSFILATHEDVSLFVLDHVCIEYVAHALAAILRLANHLHARRVHNHAVLLQCSVVLQRDENMMHTYSNGLWPEIHHLNLT